jgi:YggT family protein
MLYLLIDLIRVAATLYTILIFVRVILSWVSPTHSHPLVLLVYRLTEPVLGPVRTLLPSLGGIDFSPVIVLIGIQFIKQVLISLLINIANSGY